MILDLMNFSNLLMLLARSLTFLYWSRNPFKTALLFLLLSFLISNSSRVRMCFVVSTRCFQMISDSFLYIKHRLYKNSCSLDFTSLMCLTILTHALNTFDLFFVKKKL